MEVRFLTSDDYDTLSSWWKDWRWTAPPRDMLPEDGLSGVMVHKDGERPYRAYKGQGFLQIYIHISKEQELDREIQRVRIQDGEYKL